MDPDPVFVVNGEPFNDPVSAKQRIDEIWTAHKAPAVAAQLAAVQNKAEDPAAAHAATGAVLQGADA